MNFQQKKYLVVKNAIDKKIINFVLNYFLMKRQVSQTLFDTKYISPFTDYWGVWNDEQVPNTYSHYADIAMETLLLMTQPVIETKTNLKLLPTYSYARIYKNGDLLKRHKDRFSCEISATLNLGGDEWPIYLEPDETKGKDIEGKEYVSDYTKGVKINLRPGDLLIYKGKLLEHWREKFNGDMCCQVFLHYNSSATKNAKENIFDKRPHLGLPAWFKDFKLL